MDVPERWNGGAVVDTDENIMCRIWRTWETRTPSGDSEFDIIYEVSQEASVGLQAYTWDEDYEGYTFDHKIESRAVDEQDDHTFAEIAKELMQSHNHDV